MRFRGNGTGNSMVRILLALIVTSALMLIGATSANADAHRGKRGDGHPPFSVLAARWWQWGLSQPAATNPLLDPTGEFCAEGQRGRIWFLAGPFLTDDQTLTRSCTVPAGKDLFFPLVNVFSGWVPGEKPELRTVAAQRAVVASSDPRNAINLSLTVDGRPALKKVKYEESVVFKVVLPEGNIFDLPAGTVVSPTVDAGYYAYVKALRPGKHVIRFTGQLPTTPDHESPGLVDVTYHLTVKKR